MTKVTMYQANDGSLHKKPAERDAKNVELRTAPLVEEFVTNADASLFWNAGDEPITSGLHLDLADLPKFIITHADALRALLNRAVQPAGRPRKAKDGAEKPPRKPRAVKPAKPPVTEQAAESKPADTAPDVDPLDSVLDSLS